MFHSGAGIYPRLGSFPDDQYITLAFSKLLRTGRTIGHADHQTYCVNQQQASKLLQSLRQSNANLASHLQVCQSFANYHLARIFVEADSADYPRDEPFCKGTRPLELPPHTE